MLIPALVKMLTENEEDMDTWASTPDIKDDGAIDPFSIAVNAINRLSMDLGEKTVLNACTPLIKTCI